MKGYQVDPLPLIVPDIHITRYHWAFRVYVPLFYFLYVVYDCHVGMSFIIMLLLQESLHALDMCETAMNLEQCYWFPCSLHPVVSLAPTSQPVFCLCCSVCESFVCVLSMVT